MVESYSIIIGEQREYDVADKLNMVHVKLNQQTHKR